MNRNATRITLLACLGLLTLAGCNNPELPPPGVKQDKLPEGAYPSKVAIEGLDKVIVARDAIVQAATEATPMRVTVPIRSTGNVIHYIQYRFEFLDREGRPVRSNQGWRFMSLEPKIEAFVDAGALDTDAVDWRLQIRPAR